VTCCLKNFPRGLPSQDCPPASTLNCIVLKSELPKKKGAPLVIYVVPSNPFKPHSGCYNYIECDQKYFSKIKSLKKGIWDLSFKKEALQNSNDELHTKIDTHEIDKQAVHFKCEDFEKLILNLSYGQENLDKLLCSQRMWFNKEGIGYNPFNKKKCVWTLLFNRRLKANLIFPAIIAQRMVICLIHVLLGNLALG